MTTPHDPQQQPERVDLWHHGYTPPDRTPDGKAFIWIMYGVTLLPDNPATAHWLADRITAILDEAKGKGLTVHEMNPIVWHNYATETIRRVEADLAQQAQQDQSASS